MRAALTAEVLQSADPAADSAEQVRGWIAQAGLGAGRSLAVLDDVAADGRHDLATLSVALREIRDLVSRGAVRRP